MGSVTDLLLYNIYLVGASFGKSGPRGVHQAFREADKALEEFNHQTIASIWHQLTKKRLITYQKREDLYNPSITNLGRMRLEKFLPIYDEKRPWDGKIFLITYDIDERAHLKRNKLRKYLKDLESRRLQESVWLNPYNIRKLLEKYVEQYKIPGTIIVSDIGKDGGVGNTVIQDLLVNLYSLEKLNDRYEEFIENSKESDIFIRDLIFQYLSILKDDPQLPFEVLPKEFLGEKAYEIYKQLQNKYRLMLIRPDRY